MRTDLTFAMVGSGGDGVVTMGDLIAQGAARDGLSAIKTEAYGPQIRGGESSCTVRVASREIFAQGDAVDVLVVFGWADFARFRGEIVLAPDAVVLYEASDPTPLEDLDPAPDRAWVHSRSLRGAREDGLRPHGLEERRDARRPRGALRPARGDDPRRRCTSGSRSASRARRGQRPRVRRRDRVGASTRRPGGRGEAVRIRDARAAAPHVGQRGDRDRRAPRGLPLLRRLPDHAFLRDPPVPRRVAARSMGGSRRPDRGRARRDRRRHRRVVRRREVDDGDVRARALAHDRDARPRLDGRGARRRS